MKKMLDWLTRFIWISEIIFLAASTPHIATYFAHFDNPTDLVSSVYAWGVGYGLALLIDGISFIVLVSMMFSIKYRRPRWLITFLVFAMVLVSTLSWFINWQYNIVFASTTFALADKIEVFHTTIGNLNPIIGGAFPFLSVLYALVAKAIEVDEGEVNRSAMTPEQFEMEKVRIAQEQELRTLRNTYKDGKGLLSIAQETVMGRSIDADELLNRTLSYLRDARELLPATQQEVALQALSTHLSMKHKAVLPLLIQARSIIGREEDEARVLALKQEEEERIRRAQAEDEERMRQRQAEEEALRKQRQAEEERRIERERLAHETQLTKERLAHEERIRQAQAEREERIERERLASLERERQAQIERDLLLAREQTEQERLRLEREEKARLEQAELLRQTQREEERMRQAKVKQQAAQESLLDGLQGNDTVPLETAATYLGYDMRYIARLRNEGKLKHPLKHEELITVASLRAYGASHKRRTPTTEKLKATSNGHSKETIPLDEYPEILV